MPKKDLTSIVLVVDRSGSMKSIAEATQEALSEFIGGQVSLPGDLTVDTVFFDNRYEERAVLVNPKLYPLDLTIHPRGMTALYDAVGTKIKTFGANLAELSEDERPEHVIFVIATDGAENSSTEFTRQAVAEAIKIQKEKYNWNFTFIGANQDAVLTAKDLNIGAESAITFAASAAGTQNVLRSMGAYSSAVRSGKKGAYSNEDRKAALDSDA